jgi:hypothetical protein
MNRIRSASLALIASIAVALALPLAGCHSGSTTTASFTSSATAPTAGLVKLMQKSRSGSRVVIDVVIFGPEQNLDLFGTRFGVKIEDTSVVRFVPQTNYTQTALVAGDGQAIAINVDGASDPSLVQVDAEKQGGGAGNGFATDSAVVIELSFDLQGSGTTTLTLTGLGDAAPEAFSSTRTPIADVTFDSASASVRGVTTGGGGY